METTAEISTRKAKSKAINWTMAFFCFALWVFIFRVPGRTILFTFSGLHEIAWDIIRAEYFLTSMGIWLIPWLLDKMGLISKPGSGRAWLVIPPAVTLLLLMVWFLLYLNSVFNLTVSVILYALIVLPPSIGVGIAIRRVVTLWKPEKVGLYIGLFYTAYFAFISLMDALLQNDYTLAYIGLSAPVLIALLFVLLASGLRRKDEHPVRSHTHESPLSGNLFRKAVILSVLYCIFSALVSTGFYYEELPAEYLFDAVYNAVACLSLAIATLLLFKRKWLPLATVCMLFLCFSQGLQLYPLGNQALGLAYSMMNSAGSFPLIILVYTMPMFLCATRGKAGLLAAMGFGLLDILEGLAKIGLADHLAQIKYSAPGVLLPFGLLLVGLTFYVYILYQRRQTSHLLEIIQAQHALHKTPQQTLETLALTPREKELAGLLLTGEAQKNIAAKMGVSYSTVRFHSNNLYRKLNIQSRAELFALFSQPVPMEMEDGAPREEGIGV